MKNRNHGFTRLELVFAVLGFALVGLPAISLLGSSQSESQRAVCFNNLRRIGRAFHVWSADHGNLFPWGVEWGPDGGSYEQPGGLKANAWYQFTWISNQLGSPKFLVCPADAGASKVARTWGTSAADGGFLQASYQGHALSYFIGLHSLPSSGASLLSGDRNFKASIAGLSCPFAGGGVASGLLPNDPSVQWTNAVHGTVGNLLFGDGSVQFSDSAGLQEIVRNSGGNNITPSIHFLPPR